MWRRTTWLLIVAAALAALVMTAAGCSSRPAPAPPARAGSDRPPVPATAIQPNLEDSSSVEAALAVLRAYYDAIAARDFRRAYQLWEGAGAASGKSFTEFAAGFTNTASVSVSPGPPGPIEGAAGSRYVEIPVGIAATTRDGVRQRFSGSYVLRRAEVDGATPEQRRWHLYSAKIARDSTAR